MKPIKSYKNLSSVFAAYPLESIIFNDGILCIEGITYRSTKKIPVTAVSFATVIEEKSQYGHYYTVFYELAWCRTTYIAHSFSDMLKWLYYHSPEKLGISEYI